MKRKNMRSCRQCRVRRTRAKLGVCIQCRGGELPEIKHEGPVLHIGSVALTHESALRLADAIVDAVERGGD